LKSALEKHALRPTGWIAMGKLMTCFASGACQGQGQHAPEIISILERRYPGHLRVLLMQHEYLKEKDADISARIDLLEGAMEEFPDNLTLLRTVHAEYLDTGNTERVLENARHMMRLDRKRRTLPVFQVAPDHPGG
jgi:hypothetical protein